MKTFYRYLLLLIMSCVGLSAMAQATTYPFQLNAVMLPPYTNCLGDYMSNGRMQLTAILRDMSRYNGKPVKFSLHLRVKQGNTVFLETESHTQYVLNTVQMINQLNVRELFNLNNPNAPKTGLLNVKKGLEYADNGWCLPEGSYEFVFQMFDYYDGKVPLSEPFSVFTYLQQAEAPIGIQPIDGGCGIGTEPGLLANGVQFQWMTPIAIGPSVTNRKYSLEIYENGKYSSGAAPMFSDYEVQTGQSINAHTYNTTFAFVPTTEGGIQPYSESVGAKTYKWRVKVSDASNGEASKEYNAYKNGGYSEWYTFTYGPCPEEKPLQLSEPMAKTTEKVDKNLKVELVEAKGEAKGSTANLKWKLTEGSCNYFNIYYYKQGEESSTAERLNITGNEIELTGIEPGVTYECYVVAYNNNNGSDNILKSQKSNIGTFKIEVEKKDDECNTNLDKIECDAEKLVKDLKASDGFYANGRFVKVVEIKQSADGVYSGDALLTTELFKNSFGLEAEMKKVKIHNVDGKNELCQGTVKIKQTERDDDKRNLLLNINELLGKLSGANEAETQENLGETVSSIDPVDQKYWGSTVIHEGKLYAVSVNGSAVPVGQVVDPKNMCDMPSYGQYYGLSLDTEYGYVIFEQASGLNGSDYDPYVDNEPGEFKNNEFVRRGYTYISNGSFYAPWISMVQGDARKVKAVFKPRSGAETLDMSKVEFYCYAKNQAVKLNADYNNDNTFTVTIPGGDPKKALDIYVCVNAQKKTTEQSNSNGDNQNAGENGGSDNGSAGTGSNSSASSNNESCQEARTIGFARIYTLKSMTKKILLVPVAGVSKDDVKSKVGALTESMNSSFEPLGKRFEFTVSDHFDYELSENGFNTSEGNNFFSNETEEMQALQGAFANVLSEEEQAKYNACLFLLPKAKKNDLYGYMPRGTGRGYIFVGENSTELNPDVIGHELCHGLFGIEHTFSYSSVGQGAVPENLMDYSNTSNRYLSKYYQWVASDTTLNVLLALDKVESGEGYKIVEKYGVFCIKDFMNVVPIYSPSSKTLKELLSEAGFYKLPNGQIIAWNGDLKNYIPCAFNTNMKDGKVIEYEEKGKKRKLNTYADGSIAQVAKLTKDGKIERILYVSSESNVDKDNFLYSLDYSGQKVLFPLSSELNIYKPTSPVRPLLFELGTQRYDESGVGVGVTIWLLDDFIYDHVNGGGRSSTASFKYYFDMDNIEVGNCTKSNSEDWNSLCISYLDNTFYYSGNELNSRVFSFQINKKDVYTTVEYLSNDLSTSNEQTIFGELNFSEMWGLEPSNTEGTGNFIVKQSNGNCPPTELNIPEYKIPTENNIIIDFKRVDQLYGLAQKDSYRNTDINNIIQLINQSKDEEIILLNSSYAITDLLDEILPNSKDVVNDDLIDAVNKLLKNMDERLYSVAFQSFSFNNFAKLNVLINSGKNLDYLAYIVGTHGKDCFLGIVYEYCYDKQNKHNDLSLKANFYKSFLTKLRKNVSPKLKIESDCVEKLLIFCPKEVSLSSEKSSYQEYMRVMANVCANSESSEVVEKALFAAQHSVCSLYVRTFVNELLNNANYTLFSSYLRNFNNLYQLTTLYKGAETSDKKLFIDKFTEIIYQNNLQNEYFEKLVSQHKNLPDLHEMLLISIMKIMKGTDVFEIISSTNNISDLLSNIDDVWGNANYTEFFNILLSKYYEDNCSVFNKYKDYATYTSIIDLNSKTIDYSASLDGNDLSIVKTTYLLPDNNSTYYNSLPTLKSISDNPVKINMFAPIVVKINSEVDFQKQSVALVQKQIGNINISSEIVQKLSNDGGIIVPALYLKFITDKHNTLTTEATIAAVGSVAVVAVVAYSAPAVCEFVITKYGEKLLKEKALDFVEGFVYEAIAKTITYGITAHLDNKKTFSDVWEENYKDFFADCVLAGVDNVLGTYQQKKINSGWTLSLVRVGIDCTTGLTVDKILNEGTVLYSDFFKDCAVNVIANAINNILISTKVFKDSTQLENWLLDFVPDAVAPGLVNAVLPYLIDPSSYK
ncbi:MAG: fibronectin type III domain-containing protein [Paludibacteraceae bacterium]|nr:fibronectin type III domain-containing protein [Paludibacteraceae bacterium]